MAHQKIRTRRPIIKLARNSAVCCIRVLRRASTSRSSTTRYLRVRVRVCVRVCIYVYIYICMCVYLCLSRVSRFRSLCNTLLQRKSVAAVFSILFCSGLTQILFAILFCIAKYCKEYLYCKVLQRVFVSIRCRRVLHRLVCCRRVLQRAFMSRCSSPSYERERERVCVCVYVCMCVRINVYACIYLSRISRVHSCECHVAHTDESCPWMSHVTHMNESWYTYEWVVPLVWLSPVTHTPSHTTSRWRSLWTAARDKLQCVEGVAAPWRSPCTAARNHLPEPHVLQCVAVCCSVLQRCVWDTASCHAHE